MLFTYLISLFIQYFYPVPLNCGLLEGGKFFLLLILSPGSRTMPDTFQMFFKYLLTVKENIDIYVVTNAPCIAKDTY